MLAIILQLPKTPTKTTLPRQSTQQFRQALPPSLQTYKNSTYGFEFQYPQGLNFVTPSYANLQDKITQLQIPQTDYPQTNLGDAAIAISASNAKSLSDCLSQNPPENSDGFKTKTSINGTDFYMTKSSGVGAGNL